MQASVVWQDGMLFEGHCDNQKVSLDAKAPLGRGQGMTPKELVAIGLAGCTAMDVIALLKKHRQDFKSFRVETEIEQTTGVHPATFKKVQLKYIVSGNVESEVLLKSIELSQTKYCGVSAMIAATTPITWTAFVNEKMVGSGAAQFQLN